MDLLLRRQLADTARDRLDELEQQVVDSWDDLLPLARTWSQRQAQAARQAVRAAFEGVVGILEAGDLDDRSWARTRDAVLAHGRLSVDEAKEVLRSIRVTGVEALLEQVDEEIAPDDRYEVQVRVDSFCDQLVQERQDLDPASINRLLAELEQDGPDLA